MAPAHSLALLLVPLLLLAQHTVSQSSNPSQRAKIAQDDKGNLIVNATSGQRVFINGVDVLAEIASLQQQIRAGDAELTAFQARLSAAAAALMPPSLYAIGGTSSNPLPESSVERFDGKSWVSAPSMKYARYGVACTTFLGSIYATGGWTNDNGVVRFVERFDGKAWSDAPSMNGIRSSHTIVVYNNLLYVLGGWDGNGPISSVETFDGSATSWITSSRPLPTPRFNHAAVVFNSRIYVVGGATSGATSTIVFFDGTSWTSGPDMLSKRNGLGAAVLGGYIYAVGGDNGAAILSTAERFDGSTWAPINSMTFTRNQVQVAVYLNNIYAIGGFNGPPQKVVERLDINATTSWATVAGLSIGRQNFGTAVL